MEKVIDCSLENEGFIAHYYPGTKETNKAIISVGGAACNEKLSIAMSNYLRKEGYNVLVLGFYLWKGLSKNLAAVPIEYAEKASHMLVDGMEVVKGIEKLAFNLMIPAEKKYPKECEEARQDSLKRIIKFIEEWQ